MTAATLEASVVMARMKDAGTRRGRRTRTVRSHLPTAPPDFVGVGVQKAGTSWWYECLTDHPLVFHPPRVPKERHFFCDQALVHAPAADVRDRYASQFPRPLGAIAGEWTPRYMYDGWPLQLLTRCAPEARLLVLLRDPLERCYSGLRHQLDRRRPVRQEHVDEAIERSCYGPQLRMLQTVVGPDRVLVQQFERCVARPADELSRAFAFLGVPDAQAPSVSTPVNRSSHRGQDVVRAAYGALLPPDDELRERMAASVDDVAEDLNIDLSLWPTLGAHP